MKKILGALICLVTLACGAVDAKAALLTDWSYNLTSVSLSNVNTDFVTESGNSISFNTGNYGVDLTPGDAVEGTLAFSGDNTSASSTNNNLVSQTTNDAPLENTPATKLADLSFSYNVNALDENGQKIPNVYMSITYTIPLYTYYDAAAETAYIYYNNSEVSTRGATNLTHDGYSYGITGVGLFVDDRALVALKGAEGDSNLYTGWAINNDTFYNDYSKYEVGKDNSDFYLGAKETEGAFDITGVLSITNTNVSPDPAPTPEPATMLLMGAGLIGLGFVARRRNSK